MKGTDDGLQGPIAKFFKDRRDQILEAAEAKPGDLLLFVASTRKVVADSLGYFRQESPKEQVMIT